MFIAFLGNFFFFAVFSDIVNRSLHAGHDVMFEPQSLVSVLKLMQCPEFPGLWNRDEGKEKD